MPIELILFLTMVIVFAVSCFKFKLPVSVSLILASVAATLVGGYGLPVRHFVEGSFGYVDAILVIVTAMLFMKSIEKSGTLHSLNYVIIDKFYESPIILLIMLMLVVMFPGMITGSSTAAVLTAGSLVAPVLMLLGIPMVETACIIAVGGMLGMIAPPVNVPVMIIGGGVDMPYSGFTVPLLIITLPIAVFTVLYFGLKNLNKEDKSEILRRADFENRENLSFMVYAPLVVLLLLMVTSKALPTTMPNFGLPLIFLISALSATVTGKKFNVISSAKEAVKDALPVSGILIGVGTFIQIMTMTGVRGYVVVNCISLPSVLLLIAIAVTIPLFGAVSAYGSASVLGVPFLLALISKDQIMTASALSLIAALGDMMPPTALAGLFAAKVVGVENYVDVLKKSIVPAALFLIVGILTIVFANNIASIIF